MDALQSWWEIPSIAHFCSLFRTAFGLPDFDIEELEEALLAAGTDEGSPFLEDLFCRILQGCYGRDDIEPYNYEIYLKDVLKQRWEIEDKKENPLDGTEYRFLNVKKKVEVLHSLCDFRLDALDVMDQLKGLEGENMRVDPLGKDGEGATYWYFYGSRLYKEDAEPEPVKEEKREKKTKNKRKEKREKDRKNKKQKKKNNKTEKRQQQVSSSGRPIRASSRMKATMLDNESDEEDDEDDSDDDKPLIVRFPKSAQQTGAKNSDQKHKNVKSKATGRRSRSSRRSKVAVEDVEEGNVDDDHDEEEEMQHNSDQPLECNSQPEEENDKEEMVCSSPSTILDDGSEMAVEGSDEVVHKNKLDEEEEDDESKRTEIKKENKEGEMPIAEDEKKDEEKLCPVEKNEPGCQRSREAETKLDKMKQEDEKLEINPRWHLICTTLEHWEALAEKFKDSKLTCEKDLHRCITVDFLPAIPEIIEARERERKKRMLETAPRRLSSRIKYKRKEQLDMDKILAEAEEEEERQRQAEEEERRKEEENRRREIENKKREERQRLREERAKRLEQREQRAKLIAEGKEIPPELKYTASAYNSKYREDDDTRPELDEDTIEDMTKVLEMVKAHKDAWPFMEPVDEEVAPGYHDVIKKPMDISLIEKKLNNRVYKSARRFVQDFNLMLGNCRHFNGLDCELGMMAQRLQRCVNKAVKIHLDKNDFDDDDEDFKANKLIRSEQKKYRPKRAASSRAMDTLHRAMNSDDEMYDEDEEDSDGSQSPKPYRKEKLTDLEPPKLTPCRLIPELSARHNNFDSAEQSAWSGVQKKQLLKPIGIQQSEPKWTVDGAEISFNGKKLLYNYSHNRTKLISESKSFSPYKPHSPLDSEKVEIDSRNENTESKKVVTFNGKTFEYTFGRSKTTPRKSNKLEPLYRRNTSTSPKNLLKPGSDVLGVHKRPLSPKGQGIRPLSPKGPAILPLSPKGAAIKMAGHTPIAGSAQYIAGHGQSGGTVKVSPGESPAPLGINLPLGTGQRIIKIVTPRGQLPTSAGSRIINLGGATSSKAIKVQGGMLLLEGQPTGIQIPGKARIIYQGSTTQVSPGKTPVTTDSVSPKCTISSQLTTPPNLSIAEANASPSELHNNVQRLTAASEQSDASSKMPTLTVSSQHSGVGDTQPTPQTELNSVQPANTVGNLPNLACLQSGVDAEVSGKGDTRPNKQLSSGKSLSEHTLLESVKTEVGASESSNVPSSLDPPVLEPETTYIGLSKTSKSNSDIPELSPMRPPSHVPKKRKIVDGSNSSSPPKVFVEGLSNSPSRLSWNSPKQSVSKDKLDSWKISTTKSSSVFSPYKSKTINPSREVKQPVTESVVIKDESVSDSEKTSIHQNVFTSFGSVETSSVSTPSVVDPIIPAVGFDNKVPDVSGNDNIASCVGHNDSVRAVDTTVSDHSSVSMTSSIDSQSNIRLQSPTQENTASDSPKKSSPDKGNLFDNFANFLHTDSSVSESSVKTSSSSPECELSNSQVNSLSSGSVSDSSHHFNNSQPYSSLGQLDSLQMSKPRLPQSMMDKVSAFAANLHTGSLASRLGNLSPTKASGSHQAQQHTTFQMMPQYQEMVMPPGGYYPQFQPVDFLPHSDIFADTAGDNSDLPLYHVNSGKQ